MSLPESTEKIVPVRIEEEVKTSFLDYAMSVIVSRALPDVRDGLKPVQRRILYTMYDLDIVSGKPHKKSARIVGDVLGKYHPHGDMSVYDAMVRMAQNFSFRYPLVDGHGNFGSVDGDSPAAMRYTEVRLAKIAEELLLDIEKETVDFAPNYDESLQEPKVLPAKIPQLLMNGASGIAVGMATNIPPHNLRELIDGLCHLIDNPDCNIDDLMQFIKGPDFPTFGYIRGNEGIRDAYTTGRGSVVLRGKYEKEETQSGKKRIIITQLPYQVNKANLVTKIAELARDKKIIGISDIRDESDRQGMSIVIELKKDTDADRILKYLCKHTQLQTTFNVLMLALVDSKPQVLNLKQMLEGYFNHRREVVRRRTVFELNKAQERAHILEGLKIALDHLDEIISLIRASKDVDSARQGLMKNFSLSEKQAQAILDLRLQRLTGLERKKLDDEYKELIKKIAYYQDLLADEKRIYGVIKEELLQIKETYGDARKTIIWSQSGEINFEEIIPDLEVIVTLTKDGYIKRVPATTYKIQRRGGRGITGTTTKEEDIVDEIIFSNTLHHLLFFSQKGIVYRLRTFDIPEFGRQAKGTALVNLIQIQSGENISACISTSDVKEEGYLFMTTKYGTVKKTSLTEFVNIQKNGKIALTLDKGDELGWVQKTDGNNEIILASKKGQSIRFNEKDVRFMGRTAKGVRGMRLKTGDEVRGMVAVPQDKKDKYDLLVVTTTGHGKRTKLINFRAQNRGGSGVRVIKLVKANAEVIGITIAMPKDELVLISSSGIIIKMAVRGISTQGRQSQGVRLMRMDKDDAVVALEVMEEEEEG